MFYNLYPLRVLLRHPQFRKVSCLVLVLCCVLPAWGQGQSVTVSGRVTDGMNGGPLPGVNVVVAGTTTGTTTDPDGRYTLNFTAPRPNLSLSFSYLGYVPETRAIAAGPQPQTIDV